MMSVRRPSTTTSQDQQSVLSTPTTTSLVSPGQLRSGTLGAAETEDYVRYLLEGSGAEHNIDFSKLRRELEIPTPSVSRVLDLQSFNTVESPGNILSSAGTPREDRTQASTPSVLVQQGSIQDIPVSTAASMGTEYQRQRTSRSAYSGASGRSSPTPFIAEFQQVSETRHNTTHSDRNQSAPLVTDSLRSGTSSGPQGLSNFLTDATIRPAYGTRKSSHSSQAAPASERESDRLTVPRPDNYQNATQYSSEREERERTLQNSSAPRPGSARTNSDRSGNNFGRAADIGNRHSAAGTSSYDQYQLDPVDHVRPESERLPPDNDLRRRKQVDKPYDNSSYARRGPSEYLDQVQRGISDFKRSRGPGSLVREQPEATDFRPSISRHSSREQLTTVHTTGNTFRHEAPRSQTPTLERVSDELISAGFPPLHPSLLHATVTDSPGIQGAFTDRQVEAIRTTISSLIAEYNRRGEAVQNLVNRVADAEREGQHWREKVKDAERARHVEAGTDLRTIEELQNTVKSSVMQNTTLTAELSAARTQTAELTAKCEQLKRRVREEEDMVERLKMNIADMQEKAEKTRLRNERTFATITGQYNRNPNKSGLDRLTLEVIEVYEEKLTKARQEVEELRAKLQDLSRQARSNNVREEEANGVFDPRASLRGSRSMTSLRGTKSRDGINLDAELTARGKGALELTLDEERYSQLQRAMGQQINSLQARLQATTAALQNSQKEAELLKLQLLASKKVDWITQSRRDRTNGIRTRELIRMDKKAYKLRLFKIDGLNLEECQEILKDVCVRFDVDDVERLSSALETVEMAVRLIPQMENFIKGVDKAVERHRYRFVDGEDDRGIETEKFGPKFVRRLPEVLGVVMEWSRMIGDVEVLRDFRTRVHSMIKVRQTPRSDESCFDEIRRLQATSQVKQWPRSQAGASDIAQQAVNHFRDLFELRPSMDVVTKMNDLYVFYAEIQAGLAQLREALGLDQSVQPGRVLVHAADAVQSMAQLSDAMHAMRRSIRRDAPTDREKEHVSGKADLNEKAQGRDFLDTFMERTGSDTYDNGQRPTASLRRPISPGTGRLENEPNGMRPSREASASSYEVEARRSRHESRNDPLLYKADTQRSQQSDYNYTRSQPYSSQIREPDIGSRRSAQGDSYRQSRGEPRAAGASYRSTGKASEREQDDAEKRLEELLMKGDMRPRSPLRDTNIEWDPPHYHGAVCGRREEEPMSLNVRGPRSEEHERRRYESGPRTSTPEYAAYQSELREWGEGLPHEVGGNAFERDRTNDLHSGDITHPSHQQEDVNIRRVRHSPGYSGLEMLLGKAMVLEEPSESLLVDPEEVREVAEGEKIFGSGNDGTVLLEGQGEGGDLSFGDMGPGIDDGAPDEFSFGIDH